MQVMIIGGGPAGRTAAIEAVQIGEKVTLIEKAYLGGKCLNEGCMVVSGLNDLAKFLKDSKRFHELGIISDASQVDFEVVSKGIKDTITKIRSIHEAETREAGVEVIEGAAEFVGGSADQNGIVDKVEVEDKNEIKVLVNGETHEFDKLILATGSRAYIPPIKGAEDAKTYRDVLEFKEVPEKLIIMGSGVIAAEFASIFSAMGSEVHVLCRNKFLKVLEDDAKNYLVRKLLDDVVIHENVQFEEITHEGLNTGLGFIEGEVLLATGMTPNSELLKGIVDLGEKGEVLVNKRMETSLKDVYAAGDLIGGLATTPVARMEGVVAARNACGIYAEADYRFIPNSISLYYDVAFMVSQDTDGTESAKAVPTEGSEMIQGSIPGFAGPGSFWRVLDRNTGFTKVKVDSESGEIRDVLSISPSARTSMAYISKMMRENYKAVDFDDFMETHPSTDPIYKLLRLFAKFV